MNLAVEPWLPVATGTGVSRRVSLRDALLSGRDIAGLAAPYAVQNVALLRLLLALAHRVYGPADMAAWRLLWDQGLDPDLLDRYLEQHLSAFDASVFMQYEQTDAAYPAPVARLAPYRSEADGCTWRPWEPMNEDPMLLLIAAHAAAPGGFGAGRVVTWAGPLSHVAGYYFQGADLLETLLLNLPPYMDSPGDLPSWEGVGSTPGRLAGYTERSKPVRLADDQVLYLTGVTRPGRQDVDPMLCYRPVKSELSPLPPNRSRPMWAQAETLLRLHATDYAPPTALVWAAQLVLAGVLSRSARYRLRMSGIYGRQARVDGYSEAGVALPGAVLADEDLCDYAIEAVSSADTAAKHTANMVRILAIFDEGGKSGWELRQSLLAETYWAPLTAAWDVLLAELPADPDAALDKWRRVVRHQALAAYEAIMAAYHIPMRQEVDGWTKLRKSLSNV
ncbi:MAG: type I-E CRISPR-associated protein Cse1/CasA [Chloroflexota bacterium]|nr:type I-E CRISPR-associated protein Cse1/CasA [Chloroflexota bacterium]